MKKEIIENVIIQTQIGTILQKIKSKGTFEKSKQKALELLPILENIKSQDGYNRFDKNGLLISKHNSITKNGIKLETSAEFADDDDKLQDLYDVMTNSKWFSNNGKIICQPCRSDALCFLQHIKNELDNE